MCFQLLNVIPLYPPKVTGTAIGGGFLALPYTTAPSGSVTWPHLEPGIWEGFGTMLLIDFGKASRNG